MNRSRWLPIAGLGLALLMVTLDMTIVAVALPVIGRDLQASPQQAQWVMLAAAPALWVIIAACAIQGAFAGLIGPVVLAVVAAAVRPSDRGRALGLIAAVAALGAVLGLAAGGILAGTLGWRAVFLINLPMCLAAAWIDQRGFLTLARRRTAPTPRQPSAV